MPTIDEIRAQYPAPVCETDVSSLDPTAYCVGGAICQAWGALVALELENAQFPGELDLAYALRDINEHLDDDEANLDIEQSKAMEFADAIIQANDHGDF